MTQWITEVIEPIEIKEITQDTEEEKQTSKSASLLSWFYGSKSQANERKTIVKGKNPGVQIIEEKMDEDDDSSSEDDLDQFVDCYSDIDEVQAQHVKQ